MERGPAALQCVMGGFTQAQSRLTWLTWLLKPELFWSRCTVWNLRLARLCQYRCYCLTQVSTSLTSDHSSSLARGDVLCYFCGVMLKKKKKKSKLKYKIFYQLKQNDDTQGIPFYFLKKYNINVHNVSELFRKNGALRRFMLKR